MPWELCGAGEAAKTAGPKGSKKADTGGLPTLRLPVAHVLSRELQAYFEHVCSVLDLQEGARAGAGAHGCPDISAACLGCSTGSAAL